MWKTSKLVTVGACVNGYAELVMPMVWVGGAGMEVVDGMHVGQSQRELVACQEMPEGVGCMSRDARGSWSHVKRCQSTFRLPGGILMTPCTGNESQNDSQWQFWWKTIGCIGIVKCFGGVQIIKYVSQPQCQLEDVPNSSSHRSISRKDLQQA